MRALASEFPNPDYITNSPNPAQAELVEAQAPTPASNMTRPPRILTIAGSDSSGGAGIHADIKTITMLGGYAMSAITAVTAQNTLGVSGMVILPAAQVAAQIDACVNDIGVDAVKIGILCSPEIATVVADRLEKMEVPIVFDPVLLATSGAALTTDKTIACFERISRLATLSTPNAHEYSVLRKLNGMFSPDVCHLITGGDDESDEIVDLLLVPGEAARFMSAPRIVTRHTHGTGCTLSSAIATYLGQGLPLAEAVDRARQFVRAALLAAPGFGQGHGPLGHQAVGRQLSRS